MSPSPSDREEADVLGWAAGKGQGWWGSAPRADPRPRAGEVQEGREVRCRGGEGGLPGRAWGLSECRQAGESDKCGLCGRSADAGSHWGNERRETGLPDQRLGEHGEGPGQSQGTSPRSVSATILRGADRHTSHPKFREIQ